jgi:hypothetical protein
MNTKLELHAIHGFTSPGEYDRFVEFIARQLQIGTLVEVPADANYGAGQIWGGRWFRVAHNGQVWRLVSPDFPLQGLWEPVRGLRTTDEASIPLAANPPTRPPINLLVGFDAMCVLLEARHMAGEQKSDDLATLLSNLNRDVWANGQPLDIAQWSDWLDAILAVRPDLDHIRQARQMMQNEYERFQEIDKIRSPDLRKEVLDEYLTDIAKYTWHRVGCYEISVSDAYEAFCVFLSAYWNRGGGESRDLAAILESLAHRKGEPSQAQLSEWIAAVRTAEAAVGRLH